MKSASLKLKTPSMNKMHRRKTRKEVALGWRVMMERGREGRREEGNGTPLKYVEGGGEMVVSLPLRTRKTLPYGVKPYKVVG